MSLYLLDTHILLWAALDPEKLSAKVQRILEDEDSILYMSAASIWEIGIKHAKGTLLLDGESEDFIDGAIAAMRLTVLPIEWRDCLKAAALPPSHSDPFDRMIIQQAIGRRLPIITVDPLFKRYRVKTVA